ncbi:unnamed protein product, partial [Iphiclides podalirius]
MRSGDPINAPSDCARHPRPTPRPATQFATEKTPLVPRRVTPCALGRPRSFAWFAFRQSAGSRVTHRIIPKIRRVADCLMGSVSLD